MCMNCNGRHLMEFEAKKEIMDDFVVACYIWNLVL